MAKKLKILHTVEFYAPSVGGAQEVVRQLSEHFVLLGHDVTVATTKIPGRTAKILNGVKIKEFEITGNEVRGYSGSDIKKYQRLLVDGGFDVVMNYAAQQWATDLCFQVIDKVKARKVLVPCGFSGLYDPAYQDYFHSLPEILKKYDATVYLSHDYRDINFAKKHKLANIHVIPNGADEREFGTLSPYARSELEAKYGIPTRNKLILQIANHTGQKGHKEAFQTLRRLPVRDVSLVLIGDVNLYGGCYRDCVHQAKVNNLLSRYVYRDGKTFHVLHVTRAETLKIFPAADLFLFLSNIEASPLVLFESAAAGISFLSSSAGNAGEIAKWLGNGQLVKGKQDAYGYTQSSVGDAASKIAHLLTHPVRRLTMAKTGRSIWHRRYTWAKLARAYEKIYE